MSLTFSRGSASDALISVAREESPLDELKVHTLLALLETCRSIHEVLRAQLARSAITETGFCLLAHLVLRKPQAVAATELAPALNLSRSDVSIVLGRLETSRLITRERAGRGRNGSAVRVTASGLRVFQAALLHHLEAIKQVMSVFRPADLPVLDRACTLLRASVLSSSRS